MTQLIFVASPFISKIPEVGVMAEIIIDAHLLNTLPPHLFEIRATLLSVLLLLALYWHQTRSGCAYCFIS